MKRLASALALVLALGTTAGCAEYTTTGAPQEGAEVSEAGETLAPGVDPLVGTSWVLKSASSSTADLTTFPITASFAEGAMSGKAPVNTYTATYEVEADTQIQIGPVAATKMAGPAAAMAAEGAYFALLEQVTGFVVSSEELQLIANDEPVLVYEAGDQAAAEDPATKEAQAVADTLVGQTAEEAEKAVVAAGLTWRVIAEDGKFAAVTSDYNPARVNVEVTDGKVTAASVG
jgi:heat shock protein HslJ